MISDRGSSRILTIHVTIRYPCKYTSNSSLRHVFLPFLLSQNIAINAYKVGQSLIMGAIDRQMMVSEISATRNDNFTNLSAFAICMKI